MTKNIFVHAENKGHYNMMMQIEDAENQIHRCIIAINKITRF